MSETQAPDFMRTELQRQVIMAARRYVAAMKLDMGKSAHGQEWWQTVQSISDEQGSAYAQLLHAVTMLNAYEGLTA